MNPKSTTHADDVVVRIKKEPNSSSDEMKEYAETAMNELLGWYGYDGGGEEDDDDGETRPRTRSACDSSGPDCSDSGGTPGGPWCGWCSRPMSDSGQATGAFCSELCFSQSRRASFKRNRTCDWCRHVRHTVAHVDVRDGLRHLQFCGDKCLNQYKMHIFCRETQAHLELHPHAHVTTLKTTTSGDASALITPELWLKDCKDKSPISDRVSSPSPLRSCTSLENKSSPSSRRRFYSASRRSSSSSIGKRTHTFTSQDADLEGPQDLSVRTRSPVEQTTPIRQSVASPKVTPPSGEPLNYHRLWPPMPPPVTVLVPYPIMIPVPIPLPLPIPIPLPEEILRRSTSTTSTTSTPVTTTTTTGKTDNRTSPEQAKPIPRTLRKRKRPTGSGSDEQNNRKTVPA